VPTINPVALGWFRRPVNFGGGSEFAD